MPKFGVRYSPEFAKDNFMLDLQSTIKRGLSSFRDLEIAKHERYLFDLAEPKHWAEQFGIGIRVNSRGRLGFVWSEGHYSGDELLEKALRVAEHGEYGDFGQHNLWRPYPELAPSDVQQSINALRRFTAEIHFRLPILLPERSFTINAQIVRDILTIATRHGQRLGERVVYLIAVHSPQSPPIAGFLYTAKLPASPDALLQQLLWRHHNSLQIAKPHSDQLPALLAPSAAAQFWQDYVSDNFLRTAIAQTHSPELISPAITIYEDGTIQDGMGTTPFDGEGLLRQRCLLVDNGQPQQPLLDTVSARAVKTEPRGTAIREWGKAPEPGYSNLVIAPGEATPSQLCHSIREGVWLEHLTPLPQSPSNGLFRRRANLAFLIKNGKPIARLPQVIIEGTYHNLLQDTNCVLGGDVTRHGRVSAPSLLLKDVHLSEQEPVSQESWMDPPQLWW